MTKFLFRAAQGADDIFDFTSYSAGIAAFEAEICDLADKHSLLNPRALGYSVVVDQLAGITHLDDVIAARKEFAAMLPPPHQLYIADVYPFRDAQLVPLTSAK